MMGQATKVEREQAVVNGSNLMPSHTSDLESRRTHNSRWPRSSRPGWTTAAHSLNGADVPGGGRHGAHTPAKYLQTRNVCLSRL